MYVYVVNLARSHERRIHIAAELDRVGASFEFVEGVDGRDLDVHDPAIVDPGVLSDDWPRPGTVGCAFSHVRLYQKMLEDGVEHALILQDDVKLPSDLVSLSDSLIEHLTGAEVVLLNYDSRQTIMLSTEDSITLPSGRDLRLLIDVRQPRSAAAYVITQSACKRLLEHMVPFRTNADNWGYYYEAGALDRVRCVAGMPVAKDPQFASTIDYISEGSVKAQVRTLASRYNIKPILWLISYRRKRIWRAQIQVNVVNMPFVNKSSRELC